jgi:hypothetical protein
LGSTINIGLVYSSPEDLISTNLYKLIQYLNSYNSCLINAKYSEDLDGESWIEIENPVFNETLVEKLTNNFYSELQMNVTLFQLPELTLNLHVIIEKGYFGFLLAIEEHELLSDYEEDTLEEITSEIIEFLAKGYELLKFRYAFCDHEAEIEFSPSNFKPESYALSLIPDDSDSTLNVKKGKWHINGLTER